MSNSEKEHGHRGEPARDDGVVIIKLYKVEIDKKPYEFKHPHPTGRELLTRANKLPVEQHAIYLRVKDSQPQRIGLDEQVDLTKPGVERFVTLPLDQTEG